MTPPHPSPLVEKVAKALAEVARQASEDEVITDEEYFRRRAIAAVRVVVEAAAQECTAYNTDAHPDCAALCALAIRALLPSEPEA